MDAMTTLSARLAELADLSSVEMLLSWDQLVMMPPAGAAARSQQLGTLASVAHERATAPEIGAWLDELEGGTLDGMDADIVRLARRDWERARRVPDELAAELARASTDGQERWQLAREQNDFAGFRPALERNVELARAYGQCVAELEQTPYEGLLGDYDYGLSTNELERIFGSLAGRLAPLVAGAQARTQRGALKVPVAAQRRAVEATLSRIGVDSGSWRVDVSAHPFTAWMDRRDTRLTTRYGDGDVESLLSSLHEYGHALYERQIDPALKRTNLGCGTSMSVHESQSKLWENHVARSPAFAEVMAAELGSAGFAVSGAELNEALVSVEPSAIRVSADPLTYPLHIVLRFELELALIDGSLAVGDLPDAWREGMRRLLGVEVRDDARGCLQDVHWGAGSFGYFPSYALGCLIAAQLWEAIVAQLDSPEESLRRGEVGPIREWLAEHVHRHGRRLDTVPLVERATGRGVEIEPFLRYASPLMKP
ncbi:MAG TPA: carboxypeptidase M32 [Solirubrobacteraceae bacterium]|jgi:carboxypeptidase Taq|nr:carboxypeptidase M32 [Solirubrobacteraceae bacterium]